MAATGMNRRDPQVVATVVHGARGGGPFQYHDGSLHPRVPRNSGVLELVSE